MSEKNVKINNCEFDKPEIDVLRGKNIFFESKDDKTYKLDSKTDISDDLPLTVPAGKQRKIQINEDTDPGSYDLEIIKGCSEVKKDIIRPTMIIKVA